MIDLRHGDCLEVMKDIREKSIDLILCDLPYGTTACSWDTVIPFEPLWEQYHRVIKDNGAIVLFGSEPFSSLLVCSNIKNYKCYWIWNKGANSTPLLAKKQPLRTTEQVLVFYKSQPTYNPQMQKGNPYKRNYGYEAHSTDTLGTEVKLVSYDNEDGLRYPTQIINIGQPKNNREYNHPTQKPVAILEYLIKTYTNEGDLVLDNCMGSGSTGVACVNTFRDFIGIEKDIVYFEMASKRIKEAQEIKRPTKLF